MPKSFLSEVPEIGTVVSGGELATQGGHRRALQRRAPAQLPCPTHSGGRRILQQNCSSEASVQTTENLQNDGHLARDRHDIGIGRDGAQMGLPHALARRSTPPPRKLEQQEGSDLYCGVVFLDEGGRLRVAVCRDGRQWLIQRRAPMNHPSRHPWTSVSYCVTRVGLESVAASLEYRGVTGLAEFIAVLPGRCVSRQGVETTPA